VDDPAGFGDLVGSADPEADVDVNEGLCASEKPGFKGSTLSVGANVATFGNEKEVVVVSADWVVDFVLDSGADTDVPNPGNDAVVPPNRGLGGGTPALSFAGSCRAAEGVRLNGSELLGDDCLVVDVDVSWIDGVESNLNGVGTGGFSVSRLALCTEAGATASVAGVGAVEVPDGCGASPGSGLLTGTGSFAT